MIYNEIISNKFDSNKSPDLCRRDLLYVSVSVKSLIYVKMISGSFDLNECCIPHVYKCKTQYNQIRGAFNKFPDFLCTGI